MGRVPRIRAAARAVDFADPLSESVGESRSRVLIHRLGLTAPDLQVRVRRRDGSVMARCDFGWEGHRTVGEFDGRVKYGRLLRPGQSAEDVVWAEKRREDSLRDEGWQVVRWIWAGAFLMALGGFVTALDKRFRRVGGRRGDAAERAAGGGVDGDGVEGSAAGVAAREGEG